jgi:hypothetical protein
MRRLLFILLFFKSLLCFSQTDTVKNDYWNNGSDTTNASEFYKRAIAVPWQLNKSRFKSVAIGSGILWVGSLAYLNASWYSNYPKDKFHLFNDLGEWEQVDKVGHVYSAYLGSKLFTTFFRWTGLNEKKSVLLGAGGGFAYQGIIEILDGYSAKWGFSLGDIGANAIGCGLYASQQLAWHDQRIKMKFSFYRKDYNEPLLLRRANDLYGSSAVERMLKDYNAQTYWLSANIQSFFPKSKFPKWINIAAGYGATKMLGGFDNTWIDNQNVFQDYRHIPRYKQFFISPDIDFSKLPIKSKFLKDFFKIVNVKVPFPSIEFNSRGDVLFHAYHF